jgi:hypothetical protein
VLLGGVMRQAGERIVDIEGNAHLRAREFSPNGLPRSSPAGLTLL